MKKYRIVERKTPVAGGYSTRYQIQAYGRKWKWFWEFWKEDEYYWYDCYNSIWEMTVDFSTLEKAKEVVKLWEADEPVTEKVIE